MNRADLHKDVLVLGDGETALGLAEVLVRDNFPVILATPRDMGIKRPPEGMEVLKGVRLEALEGQVGGFESVLLSGEGPLTRNHGFLALAYESLSRPFYTKDKLPAHDAVMTLTQAEDVVFGHGELPRGARTAVFLGDPEGVDTTSSAERLLRIIQGFQLREQINCHLVSPHIKVASRGLELIYGQIRHSGCLVSKVDGIVGFENGRNGIHVRFTDPILGDTLTLNPDLVIVGEESIPSSEVERLSSVLGLETGPDGFLQSDNVLRTSCRTNRRGLYAVGPSAAPSTLWHREQSIKAAAMEIRDIFRWISASDIPEAISYDRDLCAYCLTCYRVCPHGAISFTNRPTFLHLACQKCGICTSACPGGALELMDDGRSYGRHIESPVSVSQGKGASNILAFACEKSCARVLESLRDRSGLPGAVKWMEVPCAGTVRVEHILDALSVDQGIHGVLVLACHEGNCRSGAGTLTAGQLVRNTKKLLHEIGADPGIVEYISAAPNDGAGLVRKLEAFVERFQ